MQPFLKKLEEVLKIYLKETYLPQRRAKTPGWTFHDLKFFAEGVDVVSTAFTEEREEMAKDYFNRKEFRSAYLLYFTLINAAKVWKCLEEAKPFLKSGPIKILDLGCGPATASLACSAFFADRPIEIFGLEQNGRIMRDGFALWNRMAPPQNHRFTIKNINLYPKSLNAVLRDKRFNLTIAANFLSELPNQTQQELSRTLLEHSEVVTIIEPALQRVTRDLMGLRDRLLEKKEAFVVAPCLHQRRCPMLAENPRDWCHFYLDWKCPLLIRQVDSVIGNKHDYLKMAYMILQSLSLRTPRNPLSEDFWRSVSSPLLSKGKKELILCGACGKLRKIERLKRDRTEANDAFDDIKRGDIIQWPKGSRVEREDPIKILKKF